MYGCLIHSPKHADPNEMFYLTWNFSKPPPRYIILRMVLAPWIFHGDKRKKPTGSRTSAARPQESKPKYKNRSGRVGKKKQVESNIRMPYVLEPKCKYIRKIFKNNMNKYMNSS